MSSEAPSVSTIIIVEPSASDIFSASGNCSRNTTFVLCEVMSTDDTFRANCFTLTPSPRVMQPFAELRSRNDMLIAWSEPDGVPMRNA